MGLLLSVGVQPPLTAHEPDDFQPRAQIKQLFDESNLVSGDSEAIRKFSDLHCPQKACSWVCWAPCPDKNVQGEEERGDWKRANGMAEPGKLTGLDCTTPISCRPWGWTNYPCTFLTTRSPSKGRKLKMSRWSKHTLACCCIIQWSVNNLGSTHQEMCCNKWPHHFLRWKLTRKVMQ